MPMQLRAAVAITALVLAGSAAAAGSITTPEEHVLRGFFDRQSAPITASKLALTKGSTEQVRKYAQAELDMYRQLGGEVEALYRQFTLVTRPNPTGEYRPLEEGKSRGVTELTDGATYSKVGVIEQLDPNRAPPPPVVRDPKTCQSTTVAGCGPRIAPGVDLAKLEGTEFDNAYLLLTVYGHDAMMRHCTDELLFEQSNPDMVAFAKRAIKVFMLSLHSHGLSKSQRRFGYAEHGRFRAAFHS